MMFKYQVRIVDLNYSSWKFFVYFFFFELRYKYQIKKNHFHVYQQSFFFFFFHDNISIYHPVLYLYWMLIVVNVLKPNCLANKTFELNNFCAIKYFLLFC